ncbi:hypothetical protein [Natrinema pallidum]|uniref:DUF8112 domain-containing protein n=1 Tax=Natrinema pallidum TaxID=69527 RepID=A0A4P9TJW8_9EURY|nr:hypothetical protein [Natrinema pallidum]QCW05223.1 hypothetical protein FGF80_18405 [Natrinema pallidum]
MTADAADLLEWVPVAVGQRARCDRCGQTLRPNDRLEVLVISTGSLEAEIVARRCDHCSRGNIRTGTERECVLIRGRLAASVDGQDRSRIVLSGATVADRNE